MWSNIVMQRLRSQLVFLVLWMLMTSDFQIVRAEYSINYLKHYLYVRCTRRFTPGMCQDSVEPVWTFVFQQQNCTERLGCPSDWRVNRFKSYRKCIRRCKPLINIYTEFLLQDHDNLTDFFLRSQIYDPSGRHRIEDDDTDNYEEYIDKETNLNVKGPAPDPMEYDDEGNSHEYNMDIDYVEREDNVPDDDNV